MLLDMQFLKPEPDHIRPFPRWAPRDELLHHATTVRLFRGCLLCATSGHFAVQPARTTMNKGRRRVCGLPLFLIGGDAVVSRHHHEGDYPAEDNAYAFYQGSDTGALLNRVIQPREAPSSPGIMAATSQHTTNRTTSAAEVATPKAPRCIGADCGGGKAVMATSH